jgi:hypothetical protein
MAPPPRPTSPGSDICQSGVNQRDGCSTAAGGLGGSAPHAGTGAGGFGGSAPQVSTGAGGLGGSSLRVSTALAVTADRHARPLLMSLPEPDPVEVEPSPAETLCQWAGRPELAHRIQAGLVPEFAADFSGSRVHPQLGTIAASIGGLAATRLTSLATMPGATTALHGITVRRPLPRGAAFFAAALFAGVSGTRFLGAPATYGAMAMVGMPLATWLRSWRPTGPASSSSQGLSWPWPMRPHTHPPRLTPA